MSEKVRNEDVEGTAGQPPSRRPSRLPYGVATIFLGLLVIAAWVGRDRFRPVMAGSRAPSFEVETLEGAPISLDDFEGQVVLVNIWATWCAPCRYEMPSMETLYREFDGSDFEILAVSVDAAPGERDAVGRPGVSKQKLRDFAEELGLTFAILHDPEGGIQNLYQTTGVPESFLLDRDGIIVKRIAGATVWDHDRYRELIRRLLEEGREDVPPASGG